VLEIRIVFFVFKIDFYLDSFYNYLKRFLGLWIVIKKRKKETNKKKKRKLYKWIWNSFKTKFHSVKVFFIYWNKIMISFILHFRQYRSKKYVQVIEYLIDNLKEFQCKIILLIEVSYKIFLFEEKIKQVTWIFSSIFLFNVNCLKLYLIFIISVLMFSA